MGLCSHNNIELLPFSVRFSFKAASSQKPAMCNLSSLDLLSCLPLPRLPSSLRVPTCRDAAISSPSTDSPLHLLERARVRAGEGDSLVFVIWIWDFVCHLSFVICHCLRYWALSFVIAGSPLKACPERSRRACPELAEGLRGASGVMNHQSVARFSRFCHLSANYQPSTD